MSRVIPLPLKRVAERQQISPTCLLSFLNLLYHESFYCSPYSFCCKISHFSSFFFFFLQVLFCSYTGGTQERLKPAHTHTHAHLRYLKIIPESLKLLKYGWMLPFFGAAATSACAVDEISCYHPGICHVLSNYSFCCSLHRPGIDLQEEGGRYTWGVGGREAVEAEK